jgi:hypothetical protein
MVRAIAKQAEAERLRRAKVIDSEGELQAAERFARAGEILSMRPKGLQLRYLSALQNIAGERTSTVVFPLPLELLELFSGLHDGTAPRMGQEREVVQGSAASDPPEETVPSTDRSASPKPPADET